MSDNGDGPQLKRKLDVMTYSAVSCILLQIWDTERTVAVSEPLPTAKVAGPESEPPGGLLQVVGRAWLGLLIAFGAGALLACPCGIGISAVWLRGGGGGKEPGVAAKDEAKVAFAGTLETQLVGKWESVQIGDGADMELRKGGTGAYTVIQREFKWRIEPEQKPVLIIQTIQEAENNFPLPCHFAIEGNTLTLTPLDSTTRPRILRRIK